MHFVNFSYPLCHYVATALSNRTAVNVVMCFVKLCGVCYYVLYFENVLNTGVLCIK